MVKKNDIEMYSAYNEGKSVVAERFIGTLKNKIYEYMTSISKNMYINKLDDLAKKLPLLPLQQLLLLISFSLSSPQLTVF